MAVLAIHRITGPIGIRGIHDCHVEPILAVVQIGDDCEVAFHPAHAAVSIRGNAVEKARLAEGYRGLRRVREEVADGHELLNPRLPGRADYVHVDEAGIMILARGMAAAEVDAAGYSGEVYDDLASTNGCSTVLGLPQIAVTRPRNRDVGSRDAAAPHQTFYDV
jgi:hypothetical protein